MSSNERGAGNGGTPRWCAMWDSLHPPCLTANVKPLTPMLSSKAKDEFVDFKCPHCGHALAFPEPRIGSVQECPLCFQIVVVPTRGTGTAGKLPIPITAPRLNLRLLRIEDQPDLLEFITDEPSYRYIESDAPDEEDARSWLERSRAPHFADGKCIIPLGVELSKDRKIIGFVSLCLYDTQVYQEGEFDIMISRDHRSRDYGTEALLALLGFAFRGIHLSSVRAGIDSRNVAGRRMVENQASDSK